jgi:hypothetical protein
MSKENKDLLIICKECNKTFYGNQLARHVRFKHNIVFEQYILKWKYNNVKPLCKCGCGNENVWCVARQDYNDYNKLHHPRSRVKSQEEKDKIGVANKISQKLYHKLHPEQGKIRNERLRSGITEESEQRRLKSIKDTYDNMSIEEKQSFSDHSKKLWENGTLRDAHAKATATYLERSANGEYDFKIRNENVSKSITQMYLGNEFNWSKGFYDSIKGGKCYYRSSWEKALFEILDNDENVLSFNSEPFSIDYEFQGNKHKYIPDLLITYKEKIVLCEIKPIALRSIEKNVAKREVAIKLCQENNWEYLEWCPEE